MSGIPLTTSSCSQAEFVFKGITFVVLKRRVDGAIIYRDKAYFGGPWSNAGDSLKNVSLDGTFKRLLRDAVTSLEKP